MTASVATVGCSEAPGARQIVRAYHERTKHRWEAYAAGPETLDWESQPAPFRRFDGAPTTVLPRAADDDAIAKSLGRPFSALFEPWAPLSPSLATVGALLQLSIGITAWKVFGPDRWAVRANPSSGNLHPVEAYVIVQGLAELAAGVYHYRPEDHALECRARFTLAADPSPAVWVALSTVIWREAWKYGERAFRYCQLDTGHAIAALQYAGSALGWRVSEQPQIGTETLASALGLDRTEDFPARRLPDTEREEAELLLAVSWDAATPSPADPQDFRRLAGTARWHGVASTIDAHPMYRWPILNDVAEATRVIDGAAAPVRQPRPDRSEVRAASAASKATSNAASTRSVADVLWGRRSAQRFDSRYCLEREDFFGLLAALLPQALDRWKVLAHSHGIDLVLFVHRVSGLAPGLYLFTRPLVGTSPLAASLASRVEPLPVAGSPQDLDLRLIASVEPRPLARLARGLHCHQDIAAQACFALGMVAEFESAIERHPANYRAIHREAGLLGHVLYLEAEMRGLRGTGMGCFFDDTLHELLKLQDARFQTLYHFAVGKPIDDPRIETTTTGYPVILTEDEKGTSQ